MEPRKSERIKEAERQLDKAGSLRGGPALASLLEKRRLRMLSVT